MEKPGYNRRERNAMCKKLKEIHDLKPSEILSQYWRGEKNAPVDMSEILERMGIPFVSTDFTNLERTLNLHKGDNIIGMAFSKEDNLGILYSKKLEFSAVNYVLAHELAHCVMHMEPNSAFHVELKMTCDLYSNSDLSDIGREKGVGSGDDAEENKIEQDLKKETEADAFAAALLLPENFNCDESEISRCAEHYRVSEEIVRFKLGILDTSTQKGA